MRKGDVTKSAILDQALKMASVQGLEGTTIGMITSFLNMSKSGLFGKFKSKENLQIEVLRAGSKLFRRRVIYPCLKANPGRQRFEVIFDSWLKWESGSDLPGGCIFLASISELDDKPGLVRDYLLKNQIDWMNLLKQFIIETFSLNHSAKSMKRIDPDILVQEVWGMILSFHFYNRFLKEKILS